jgi:RHH-type proline utilization regulon transcriptional repressor/proline dehydrogenase/delta 1-pyrroline-5-carboxylate dehydrogenase
VRRLLENGANSSFVHQLADERLSDLDILADPVAKIASVGGSRHPSIPMPDDLFGAERKNSRGIDLNFKPELERIAKVVQTPLPFLANGRNRGSYVQPEHAPEQEKERASRAVTRALGAFPAWSSRSIEERAACLDRLADLLERDRDTLMAIAVQEAYKTIPTRWAKCARRWTSAAIMPCRPEGPAAGGAAWSDGGAQRPSA